MPGSPPTLQKGIRTAALRRAVGAGVGGSGRFNRSRSALRVLGVIGFVNDINDDDASRGGRRDIVGHPESETALMPGYHIQIVLNPPRTLHQPHPDSFIPASLFQPLPNHSPKSTLRRDTLSRPNFNKDYRTGPIRVDWIDFEQMSSILHGGKKVKEHGRGVKLPSTFVPRGPPLNNDIII
jgi:hypothetical protein